MHFTWVVEEPPCLLHPIEAELAWGEWQKSSCVERGGHWWQLDYDCEDGLDLHCGFCPADVDDLYPDGLELISADFELPGQRVQVDCGTVLTEPDYAFSLRVHARLWTEHFYVPGVADEWDVGIEVTAA